MKRTVQITADGSQTISIPELDVTYHSRHGAMRESLHVFIEAGLDYLVKEQELTRVSVFEMGFGTGLNALLTKQFAEKNGLAIYYFSIDKYPLEESEWRQLGYPENMAGEFAALHQAGWEQDTNISEQFTLHKSHVPLLELETQPGFDLVYFDAFAPAAQPELWTETVFAKMYRLLRPGGMLVTYCSKGVVRRAMTAAGFSVEKIPGPPGKKEMVRAGRLIG